MDTLKHIKSALLRLHQSEQGAEGLEKLLIIAAIALPLLGVLIYFRNELGEWVSGKWEDISGAGQSDPGPQP